MPDFLRRCGISRTPLLPALCAFALATVFTPGALSAQKLNRGFDLTLPATPVGEELNAHDDLWMFEVTFKPLRMIWVDVTDPKTGTSRRELIWYLVYQATNRPLDRLKSEIDTQPVNDLDPLPVPLFAPQFTLVTNDNGAQQVYSDEVLPEAQAAIIARERQDLKNPVEIVQPLPQPVPRDAKMQTSLYGVAMWRGVDPNTDYFTVYMDGFCNAYRIVNGPDGKPLVWRKSISQEFWRPSDQYDEREIEVRRKKDPQWIYRVDELVSTMIPGQEEKPPAPPTPENGTDGETADQPPADAAAQPQN